MSLIHKFWMEMYGAMSEKRHNPERGTFSLTDMQVDAVDDTAGLPPIDRAGKERANEHEWNNQF